MTDTKYDESSIKILEGLDAVRKRPGMYIGSTDKRGLHHLVWEIVDNSIDEVLNGYGDYIKIIIHKDNSITISDNGRGVPVGKHESGKSTPEVVYTILHAGGKFSDTGYKVAGGLHGVGASVVNALSSFMNVTIYKDGGIYSISFENGGLVKNPLTKIGDTRKTGTTVHFKPSEEIFHHHTFSWTTICERMQESAFLINNLKIEVIDEEDKKDTVFQYENGIVSFVEYINEDKHSLHKVVSFKTKKQEIETEIAFAYTDTYNENIISFVNNVKTVDGGTHEVGFKTAITKVFNDYLKANNLLKNKDASFDGSDVREGLTAIINVKIPEKILQFEGQTKSKLGTPEARGIVENIVYENIQFFLEENKEIAKTIIEKSLKSKMAREAAKKAREEARNGKSKKALEKNLSSKLSPAISKNPKLNELFLVEGDSAGGSAKKARDSKFQAILPLRGKILNTEKANISEALKSEVINTIIWTIGAGYGSDFRADNSNYDKVIIMTDADTDGAHIQILLLTFFYRFMRELIEKGKLYIASAPLYAVTVKNEKEPHYFWNEDDKDEFIKDKINFVINRYKGLGEMNADELKKTTMDPTSRNLIRVQIDDVHLAEKRIKVLMGEEVEPRKEWINENVDFSLEDTFVI